MSTKRKEMMQEDLNVTPKCKCNEQSGRRGVMQIVWQSGIQLVFSFVATVSAIATATIDNFRP